MSDYGHGIEGPTTKVLQYNTDASGKGDGQGPKKELPGGTPYSYIPYSWTEVYKKN